MQHQTLTVPEKVVETALAYYRQADRFTITAHHRDDWYDRQPAAVRQELQALHPAQWEKLPSFRRYMLEQRGNWMAVYMAAHLSPQEFAYWIDDGDGGVRAS